MTFVDDSGIYMDILHVKQSCEVNNKTSYVCGNKQPKGFGFLQVRHHSDL